METSSYLKLKISGTEIFLEDKGPSAGKITIQDKNRGNYEMYWGAMGGMITSFIMSIDEYYFTNKLLGVRSTQVFDVKATFKDVRKYIREEIDLPWYAHKEFQADMREKLSNFQIDCTEYNSEQYFVDHFFDCFESRLSFYLIEDRWERHRIERDFKSISEHWNFIQKKESSESKWLRSLHKKLKQRIQKILF